ncbi:RidA family protein [Nesterenkonia ebinurensis]|uniref:RidA family protein n=1 Tax=Nesterenkonia ebinurensis TaxID=2608252 RepID=UPI00123E42CB|nr:RidA family protein [Nesterenkonia ebinurensis]
MFINEIIVPDSLAPAKGFSHGVKAGDTVYLGGQTALNKEGKIVEGTVVDQFRQALSNVLETLREAGGQPDDLVTLTIYLTDVDDYMARGHEIGQIWREMVGKRYPAMAGIGVSQLWQKAAVVEIQGVAVIQSR